MCLSNKAYNAGLSEMIFIFTLCLYVTLLEQYVSLLCRCCCNSPVECSHQTGVPYQGSLDLSANYPALAAIHSLVA